MLNSSTVMIIIYIGKTHLLRSHYHQLHISSEIAGLVKNLIDQSIINHDSGRGLNLMSLVMCEYKIICPFFSAGTENRTCRFLIENLFSITNVVAILLGFLVGLLVRSSDIGEDGILWLGKLVLLLYWGG